MFPLGHISFKIAFACRAEGSSEGHAGAAQ